ncbi:hypothetical protein J2X60_002609 [Curtobacterium sp. 320]|uniref:hypothetical protein n=1 Tax=Curtobacterium sp. 320 TaxID=2817749 RepID=UPI00286550EC|nr:hypothetical protein [Curtobacterium sp. 320]MDR6573954.1 hypothetical protein [Curtobacterium sp. 320]
MNAVNRLLLTAAVALSPATHRADRREQWLADVRDARALDLSPTALAFGALTTALFHRRAGHRSSWGSTMSAAPLSVRRSTHTIPTIPVLLVVAVGSFLAASVGIGLMQRYNGVGATLPMFALLAIGLAVVPGLAVATCVLLATGAPLRRRALGAVVVLAVTAVWLAVVTGLVSLPVSPWLLLGLVAAAWAAVWLVVRGRPGWTWSLLLLPVVASLLVSPLSNAVWETSAAYSLKSTLSCALQLVPFLVALVAVGIAGRFSTDAPARFGEHGEALVDRTA